MRFAFIFLTVLAVASAAPFDDFLDRVAGMPAVPLARRQSGYSCEAGYAICPNDSSRCVRAGDGCCMGEWVWRYADARLVRRLLSARQVLPAQHVQMLRRRHRGLHRRDHVAACGRRRRWFGRQLGRSRRLRLVVLVERMGRMGRNLCDRGLCRERDCVWLCGRVSLCVCGCEQRRPRCQLQPSRCQRQPSCHHLCPASNFCCSQCQRCSRSQCERTKPRKRSWRAARRRRGLSPRPVSVSRLACSRRVSLAVEYEQSFEYALSSVMRCRSYVQGTSWRSQDQQRAKIRHQQDHVPDITPYLRHNWRLICDARIF